MNYFAHAHMIKDSMSGTYKQRSQTLKIRLDAAPYFTHHFEHTQHQLDRDQMHAEKVEGNVGNVKLLAYNLQP